MDSERQSIEISKDGFKFAYVRFLSDAVPGFVILLLSFVAYYAELGICLANFPINLKPISPEAKVAILLLLLGLKQLCFSS